MNQSGRSLLPPRVSRRQRGLSPIPHSAPLPNPYNSENSTIMPNMQSTQYPRYPHISANRSYPSITNTIDSSQRQNPQLDFQIPPHNLTHNISEHDSHHHSFAIQPSIANSSISSRRPHTAPIYLSHYPYHHHHSSYSLPPPGPTPFQPPPNISIHESTSSNSSELRGVISSLQQTISQLNESMVAIQSELRSSRADNEFLRSELLKYQQRHISSSQSDTSSSIPLPPPLHPIPDVLTLNPSPKSNPNPLQDPPQPPPSSSTEIPTPPPTPHSNPSNNPPSYHNSAPPSRSHHSSKTHVPSSILYESIDTTPQSTDPTIRMLHDHDHLMRKFLCIQQRQFDLHEKKLFEMTTTRLKKQPSNSKFPILNDKNCNPKNFREWYQKVISILATEEWSFLYNAHTQDVIPDGRIHPALNNHLYSALLLILKDSAESFIQGMGHLFGDGVAVLHELRTAYKVFLTEIELMKLQGSLLGGTHFRGRSETVEQFASRTIQIHKDLYEHGVQIPPHTLKTCFISGLGPDFHEIIKDLNKNKLDPE